jgi:hypothetical protein
VVAWAKADAATMRATTDAMRTRTEQRQREKAVQRIFISKPRRKFCIARTAMDESSRLARVRLVTV